MTQREETDGDTLMAALRARYRDADGYAVLSEVRDRTGLSDRVRNRYADMLVMSTWHSRGLEIEGFESKTNRSDWKRELDKPYKAEPIFKACDRWWLVANEGVALDKEIPAPWGWMEWSQKKGKLITRKSAPQLVPETMPREFLASLLRSLARQEGAQSAIARAEELARRSGFEHGRASAVEQHQRALAAAEARAVSIYDRQLLDAAKNFAAQTGIQLDDWRDQCRVNDALGLVPLFGPDLRELAIGVLDRITDAVEKCRSALAEVKDLSSRKEPPS